MKNRIIATLAAVGLVAAGLYGYQAYDARYPSTDNAYVAADVVHVAPQVDGRVVEVAVGDLQHVDTGALLYRIDPRPYELLVERAAAHLDQVRQAVAVDAAALASAEAEVKRLQVLLDNAGARARRNAKLTGGHFVSQQAAEDAAAEAQATHAALAVARAKRDEAKVRLGEPGDANQAVREARAALAEARWRLDNTRVAASCGGRIDHLALRPGDTVRGGHADFVLVCDDSFRVDANFKETQLAHIRPGQPVRVTVDMYPDQVFKGHVERISVASGEAFSLLPPQNATGNWVKVVQRVPVQLAIERPEGSPVLRAGMTATVSIDTGHQRELPAFAQRLLGEGGLLEPFHALVGRALAWTRDAG